MTATGPENNPPLLICSHPDDRANHPIIRQALAELSAAGLVRAIHIEDIGNRPLIGRLLAIDGDKNLLCSKGLRKKGIDPDCRLIVTELGIDIETQSFSDEDLQLLKDGIEAAGTPTDGPTPRFPCGCRG